MAVLQIITIDDRIISFSNSISDLHKSLCDLVPEKSDVYRLNVDNDNFETYKDIEDYLSINIDPMCSLCIVVPTSCDPDFLTKLSVWFKISSDPKPFIIFDENNILKNNLSNEWGQVVTISKRSDLFEFCKRYCKLVDSFFSDENLFKGRPKQFFQDVEQIVEQLSNG